MILKKFLPHIAIISISAFAGNMITIGLSYGQHWLDLEPLAFMNVFSVDFPLLLYPTAATLLPAFIATVLLYIQHKKGSIAKRYWLYALIGLLIIKLQTVIYHLPQNLSFVEQTIHTDFVQQSLITWLLLHWIRILIALMAGFFAIKAFEKSLLKI